VVLNRVNRIALGVIGALMLAAGVVGILAGNGTLTIDPPGTLYRRVSRNVVDHPDIWQWAVIGVGTLLAIACLLWVWRQVRPRHEGRISTTVVARTGRGKTSIEPVAVARAAAKDLRLVPGVTGAKVRMVSIDTRPQIVASLSILDDADPDAIRAAAEAPFTRLCTALEVDGLDVDLRLRPTDEVSARVV
jgi:hypothetical protein